MIEIKENKAEVMLEKLEFVEFIFSAGRLMFISVLFFFMLFQSNLAVKVNTGILLLSHILLVVGCHGLKYERKFGIPFYYIGIILEIAYFLASYMLNESFQIAVLTFFILPILISILLITTKLLKNKEP